MERRMTKRVTPKTPLEINRGTSCCVIESNSKTVKKNKENNDSERVFFLENECEILKLKAKDIEVSVNGLRAQLQQLHDRKRILEKQCLDVEKQIQVLENGNLPDLNERLQKLQGVLQDKAREESECERKVVSLKQTIEREIFTLKELKEKKSNLDVEKWKLSAEVQGMDSLRITLEGEVRELKSQKELFQRQKKEYGPEQHQINQQIEAEVQKVDGLKEVSECARQQLSNRALIQILHRIYRQRLEWSCQHFIAGTQIQALKRKKLLSLFLISRSFILKVKKRCLEKFKRLLDPLEEERRLVRALRNLSESKLKYGLFSVLKKEFLKSQYASLRKEQVLNSLVSIIEGMQTTLKFSTFADLKERDSRLIQGTRKLMTGLFKVQARVLRKVFTRLIVFGEGVRADSEDQHFGSKMKSLNVLRRYFNGWTQCVKSTELTKLSTKFKVMNILKRNGKEAKRNKLLQVMSLIVRKNSMNNLLLRSFWALRVSTKMETIQESLLQGQQIQQEINTSQASTDKSKHREKSRCLNIGVYRLDHFSKQVIRASFRKLQEVSLYSQKVSSFDTIVKRMCLVNSLSQGFRSLILHKTLSEQRHVKSEIDCLVKDAKQRTDNIHKTREQILRSTHQFRTQSLGHLASIFVDKYHKVIKAGLKMIQNRGLFCLKISISFRRLVSVWNKRIKVVVFDEIGEVAVKRNRDALVGLGIQHIASKKERLIKKALIQEMLLNLVRNRKMRATLKQTYKTLRRFNLSSSLSSIKSHCANLQLEEMKMAQKSVEDTLVKYQSQIQSSHTSTRQQIDRCNNNVRLINNCRQREMINRLQSYVMRPAAVALGRWNGVLNAERRQRQFASTLVRKMSSILVRRGWDLLIVSMERMKCKQMEERYQAVLNEYENNCKEASEYSYKLEENIKELRENSASNNLEAERYSKLIHNMETIKVAYFQRQWREKLKRLVLVEWRKQTQRLKAQLNRMCGILSYSQYRLPFYTLFEGIKQERAANSVRRIMKNYMRRSDKGSVGKLFVVWKQESTRLREKQTLKEIQDLRGKAELIIKQIECNETGYEEQFAKWFCERQRRCFIQRLKSGHYRKQMNDDQLRQTKVQYKKILCQDAIQTLQSHERELKQRKQLESKASSHNLMALQCRLFEKWKQHHQRLQRFKRCFLVKWVGSKVEAYCQHLFRNLKQISLRKKMQKMEKSSGTIYKLVTLYENIVVCSLQKGFSKWKNNSQGLHTKRQFLRRLLRKPTTQSLGNLFHTWKLEAQARSILKYHQEEGDIKLRRNQYKRILKHIAEFKQQKGLVANGEGTLNTSLQFKSTQNEEEQAQKLKKYQLISRLVLVQSGQTSKIHLWNSFKFYLQLKEQTRGKAQLVHNYLRNSDKYKAFRLWRRSVQDSNSRLQFMEKKELVHQIKSFEDKVDLLHSSKDQIRREMQSEVQRMQLIHSRLDTKATLSKILISRVPSNLQRQALHHWRSATKRLIQQQEQRIQQMAIRRMEELADEINQLETELSKSLCVNEALRSTAMEGVEIAETVKMLSYERDQLNGQIQEQALTCEVLAGENVFLQEKFNLAHKEAFQLLSLTR